MNCFFMKKFKILDLFSGAGGFSKGMDLVEGFSTKIALDFDKNAINTFSKNFPNAICFNGDICDPIIKQKIIETAKKENINMIIGGPPCQGFSLKGKKLGLNDPRNFLFLEYVKMVEEIKPEIFIIENVKNMIMTNNGYFIKEIVSNFEKIGYVLNYGVLNAVNFGVPQNRQRAIIIGVRKDLKEKGINLPLGNNVKQIITVKDAISDLSYLDSGDGKEIDEYKLDPESEYQRLLRNDKNCLYNHKATKHSKIAIEKLKLIPPEGNKGSLPVHLLGNQKFKTTWGRLEWNKPSPTIDTRFDTPSNGKNSHPYLNRAITPREAARLQSFPDDFIFYGNKTSICKQIGNAVPPLLAKSIAEHIKNNFK